LTARPELTQLEHLSDASFLGKLLVLPANVRPDWKVIATYKYSSLFGLIISNEEKSFITLAPGVIVIKAIYSLLIVSKLVFSQDIFVKLGPML
jgi:hypothetical protein